MTNSLIYRMAAAAVSQMDKETAARGVAAVARAVANEEGHPGLRRAAKVVADTLQEGAAEEPSAPETPASTAATGAPRMRVIAQLVAHTLTAVGDRPAAGAPAVAPASATAPATDPAAGWEHTIRAVQQLRDARNGGGAVRKPEPAEAPQAAVAANPGTAPEASSTRREVTRGTLAGVFDTANIGGYTFSLNRSNYNTQLQVNQLRASGNVGGQFSIGELPKNTWYRLLDRGNRLLPVWILVHDYAVEVQLDDGPDGAPLLSPTDMLPKNTLLQ
jgi:hypothetical protein